MFRIPDFFSDVSQRLSLVLGEIGVNEDVCFVRRKTNLIMERMEKLQCTICSNESEIYYFGSQTEGSTTFGMDSDKDKLVCSDLINAVQDENKCEQGKHNVIMVETSAVSPGYCYIKLCEPIPPILMEQSVFDGNGQFFLQNTFFHETPIHRELGCSRQGPAQTLEEFNMDQVMALKCQTWPACAKPFINKRQILPCNNLWEHECFVVPTGNSQSENEKYEWRISTSKAERYFMFNMNITQIRCYTILKLIMKGIIKPLIGEALTSFQCKSVFMHIVDKTYNQPWTEAKLLTFVVCCLNLLRYCVVTNNCPHFFIPKNNLLGGRIDRHTRRKIEQELTNILNDNCRRFLSVQIDNFGQRLSSQFSTILEVNVRIGMGHSGDARRNKISIFGQLFCRLFASKFMFVHQITREAIQESSNPVWALMNSLFSIEFFGSKLAIEAASMMCPVLCNTVASTIASLDICQGKLPSDEALELFDIGKKSDVVAGRLKLASVCYCTGEIDKVKEILDEVEHIFQSRTVVPVCNCRSTEPLRPEYEVPEEVIDASSDRFGKVYFAAGVLFTRHEIFCVPVPLQYEMFRCTGQELAERQFMFSWNDWAAVDALPYFYFLKYLTYKQMGRYSDKEDALDKLAQTIDSEPQLFHRETALNLIGQCMEHEGHINLAFAAYRWSIVEKPTHNAARWLLCALIWKIYHTYF